VFSLTRNRLLAVFARQPITQQHGLLTQQQAGHQNYIPREVFPLASWWALSLISVSSPHVVPFYIYYAHPGRRRPRLLLLPFICYRGCFAAGLSLSSRCQSFFRDVKYVMSSCPDVFFATNVVYSHHLRWHPNLRWIGLVTP